MLTRRLVDLELFGAALLLFLMGSVILEAACKLAISNAHASPTFSGEQRMINEHGTQKGKTGRRGGKNTGSQVNDR